MPAYEVSRCEAGRLGVSSPPFAVSAYQRYEVGAGYLNAYEAVRAARSQARTESESAPGDRSAHRVSRWPTLARVAGE